MDYRGAGRPDAATLHTEAPHTAAPEAALLGHELLEVPEDESEADEIQIGKVEECEEFIAGDQEDVLMEDAENDFKASEDARAADLHVQDSDDDDEVGDAEPPAKRARELQMCVGHSSVREADAQLLTSQKHAQELRSLMAYLIPGKDESCVSNQPSHDRKLQIQLLPQPRFQCQHESSHDADNILSRFLSATI